MVGRFNLYLSVKFIFLRSSFSFKYTFIYFTHFSIGLVIFYLLTCRNSLNTTCHTLLHLCHTPSSVFRFSHSANGVFCHLLIFICSNLAIFSFMEFFTLLETVLLFHPKWHKCSPLFPSNVYVFYFLHLDLYFT